MQLSVAAKIIGAEYQGPQASFDAISIDSRQISPGELYIAIVGDQFDGHDFIQSAVEKGAIAVIASMPVSTTVPCWQVQDTRQAFAALASDHRQQMRAKVVGVTGSCGKTTVKMLLSQIFSLHGNTLASQRSFNNDIGVPLTLMQLKRDHQYGVCEMGANHPGEIATLTHMVRPDVAIITNAAAAHLEGFGDVPGVACAKGEIFQGLGSDGVAILNADDQYHDFWRNLAGDHRILTFGRHHDADVMAASVEVDDQARARFRLIFPEDEISVRLSLMGEHNIMNALAAAAAAYALSVPISVIAQGLELAVSPEKRLVEKKGYAGATVIDDTYNANPLSAAAAVSVLAQRGGDSILVLGDMMELGEHANALHQQLGQQAEQLGIQRLYCYGPHSRYAADAFGENGYHFDDQEQLLSALCAYLHEGVVVLVKGSNAMGMDKITKALIKS